MSEAGTPAAAFRSAFRVVGMDDPGEETLVRMALEGHAAALRFDLVTRTVTVWHHSPADDIEARIAGLGMGAERLPSGPADDLPGGDAANPAAERRALAAVEAPQQSALDARQAEERSRRELQQLEQDAAGRLGEGLRRQELRVFLYRLALTLPLLAAAGWSKCTRRAHLRVGWHDGVLFPVW